jgi:hypothetical protein
VSARRARTIAAVAVVLAGLGLALLGSRSGNPFVGAPRSADQSDAAVVTLPPPPTTPAGNNGDQAPPRTLHNLAGLYLLVAACLLFLGLAALPLIFQQRARRWWAFHRRVRLRPDPPPPVRPGAPALLAEAAARAVRIMEQGPVDDAIVACWLGLEDAAARAGTKRAPAETSAEFTERVLAEHQVSPDTLRRLAALYREARFSGHTLGEPDRATARDLFGLVRTELQVRA